MALKVKTYFVKEGCLPRMVQTEKGMEYAQEEFIPLEEFEGPIKDPFYIEGSIEMEYGDKKS